MDQLICAYIFRTHYWYEVGMLKVPAAYTRLIHTLLKVVLTLHTYILYIMYCIRDDYTHTAATEMPPGNHFTRHVLSYKVTYIGNVQYS